MELPQWFLEPFSFLRFVVPGFFMLALATAFFPQAVGNALDGMWVVNRHEGLAILVLLFWALIIGVMLNLSYRLMRETVLRPPHPAHDALREALVRAGLPADRLTRHQMRAVYGEASHVRGASDRHGGERMSLELGYTACLALAAAGGFLIAGQGAGPLVSANWMAAQGGAFLGAAALFIAFLRWRERQLAAAELAGFPVEDPETVAAAARACQRLWGPPEPPQGVGPGGGPP